MLTEKYKKLLFTENTSHVLVSFYIKQYARLQALLKFRIMCGNFEFTALQANFFVQVSAYGIRCFRRLSQENDQQNRPLDQSEEEFYNSFFMRKLKK